jgi:ABC-type hemin transport system ATPase subunit
MCRSSSRWSACPPRLARAQAARGRAVPIVPHDLNEAAFVADRVALPRTGSSGDHHGVVEPLATASCVMVA